MAGNAHLQDYENAFILISHDIPFLNSVINLIYHMENCRLDRYPGDYDKFQEVYAMKKAQLEAAYNRQQQEISDLKDFVARNKARVATRNMAMARQKKLDKMDIIELDREKPKPEFHFKTARTSGKMIFETNDLVIGYDEPLTKPLNIRMERGERIALTGANGIGKTTLPEKHSAADQTVFRAKCILAIISISVILSRSPIRRTLRPVSKRSGANFRQ